MTSVAPRVAAPRNAGPNPRPRPVTGSDTFALDSPSTPPLGAPPSSGPTVTAGTIGGATSESGIAIADSPAGTPTDAPGDPDDETGGMDKRMRSWLEWGGVIVGALLVAFLIRAVAFQAFYIPSESMESTLEVKDRLLVNKLSYKLHDVHRGDIIVFEKPPGETSKINDLIKRVIALPGETIEQQGNDIYIDRGQGPQKLTEGYIKDLGDIGQTLTWVQGCANPSTETTKCTIPAGHVWVMGDNRGHSHDSRFFGPIDEDLIVGRAFIKVWPLNKIGFL
jgi:signal peptidase I